jgi:hypothetical protein
MYARLVYFRLLDVRVLYAPRIGIEDADKPSKASRTKMMMWYLLEVGLSILFVTAAIALVW